MSYQVAIMFVETIKSKQNGKIYYCHLLRHNYRENGKVKHKTIANLSQCLDEEIEALKLALKHKHNLSALLNISDDISVKQGLSVGAVWLIYQIAKRLGVEKALGKYHQAKLALWQVIARIIDQGSRLSAVRLAMTHTACDVLNITKTFNEQDLYDNLDWLCDNQKLIEKKLFCYRHRQNVPNLFLYDVTSSYLEGEHNAYGAYGYNRDKKIGKMQIVVGLLCDEEGMPVSVEVFPGNTRDLKTFTGQVKKLAGRFGCKHVTMTGDRGMIKSAQIEELDEAGFHYITAITKPQIEKLLREGVFQMDLFDRHIAEVVVKKHNGKIVRYILKRNPLRAKEIAESREGKEATIKRLIDKKNEYLKMHRRAGVVTALKQVQQKIEKLKVGRWLRIEATQRKLTLIKDDGVLKEIAKLDGCYVIKSDVPKELSSARTIHNRYKDLAFVEHAFRTMKSDFLEVRPVHVRIEEHTRAHVLVVMLAYMIVRELRRLWSDINITVKEGIKSLDTLCSTYILNKGKVICQKIPVPNEQNHKLLKAASVMLPEALPSKGIKVATKRTLIKKQ